MAAGSIKVVGADEVARSFRQLRKDVIRELRPALREAGEVVRGDAARRFSRISGRSAAGYKVRVRQRGVAVEQSLRKVTGLRPDYGATQMRLALVPALDAEGDAARGKIDTAVNLAEIHAGL